MLGAMGSQFAGCLMCACALSAISGVAFAAPASTALDPATVAVPDLSFEPKPSDRDHYWEYFYFQKAGVGFKQATDDWTECLSYSKELPPGFPPNFVPINADMPVEPSDFSRAQNFGLVGVIMSGIVNDIVAYDMERMNTHVCMGFKGYHRYGLSKQLWKKVTAGTAEEALIRFAKIASGPTPQAEALEP